MKDEDRQKVNYVKSELDQYHHLKRRLNQKKLDIIGRLAIINGTSSGSPAIIPTVNKEHNPHKHTARWEEIYQLEEEIKSHCFRVDKVDNFLNRLCEQDRDIINRLHLSSNDRRRYQDYCQVVYMSERTLKRHVNRIILNNW